MEPGQQIADLKGLFPHLDNEILESVLTANSGNFEGALNVLLEMSDPTQKPALDLKIDETVARALQDRMMAEELDRQLNQEQAGVENIDDGDDESSPFADKLANFGQATKKKFQEFYKKLTNREDSGSIALKNTESDLLIEGFEKKENSHDDFTDDLLEENGSAKELTK